MSDALEMVPTCIGLVGVGTIGSAVVRGLCRVDGLKLKRKFVISPRNAEKAAALAAEFPDLIRIAGSNQEVVDATDCVIISVLPKQAEEVIGALKFRPEQQVLSLIATCPLQRIRELVAPAEQCAVGVPLPAVAIRQGATLLMPSLPWAQAIFELMGGCVAVDDEAVFKRMQCMTALMGDFYKRQLTAQQWLESHDVPNVQAAAWVGAIFSTMAADSAKAGPDTLHKLVEEQTPGGVNEMVWKGQDEDGAYQGLCLGLEQAHVRFMTGRTDPDLAPAAKRS